MNININSVTLLEDIGSLHELISSYENVIRCAKAEYDAHLEKEDNAYAVYSGFSYDEELMTRDEYAKQLEKLKRDYEEKQRNAVFRSYVLANLVDGLKDALKK